MLIFRHDLDMGCVCVQSNSSVLPYLIDYDAAQSMVLVEGGVYIACTPMTPPLPDFPE